MDLGKIYSSYITKSAWPMAEYKENSKVLVRVPLSLRLSQLFISLCSGLRVACVVGPFWPSNSYIPCLRLGWSLGLGRRRWAARMRPADIGTHRMENGPKGTCRMEKGPSGRLYDELQASWMSNCRSYRYTSDGEGSHRYTSDGKRTEQRLLWWIASVMDE